MGYLLEFCQIAVMWVFFTAMMSDISGLDLPLDVKAKLAELDLELSEGLLQIVRDDLIITPEAFIVVSGMLKGGALSLLAWLITGLDARDAWTKIFVLLLCYYVTVLVSLLSRKVTSLGSLDVWLTTFVTCLIKLTSCDALVYVFRHVLYANDDWKLVYTARLQK